MTIAYVCRLLPLTCLAPDIVEAILDGRQPKGLRLAKMLGNGPVAWEKQQSVWGSLEVQRRAPLEQEVAALLLAPATLRQMISFTSRQCSCRLSTPGIGLQPAITNLAACSARSGGRNVASVALLFLLGLVGCGGGVVLAGLVLLLAMIVRLVRACFCRCSAELAEVRDLIAAAGTLFAGMLLALSGAVQLAQRRR